MYNIMGPTIGMYVSTNYNTSALVLCAFFPIGPDPYQRDIHTRIIDTYLT